MYLPVKSSGTQQSRVEHVGTVGSSKDDNTAVRAETVHLGQQLVERRFALVVTAGHYVLATRTAYGIDLVDKDDTRRFLLRLAEEVAHAARAYAHEHLYKIRTGHRQERHIRLACHSLGEQSLTRTRRTYEQRTLGNLAAQSGIFLRILEERYNFLHLLLGAFESGYVLERHLLLLVLVKHLRLGFTHAEYTAYAAGIAYATAHPYKEEYNEQERQYVHQYQIPVVARLLVRHINSRQTFLLARSIDAVHVLGDLLGGGHLGLDHTFGCLAAILVAEHNGVVHRSDGRLGGIVVIHNEFLHHVTLHVGGELGVTQFFLRTRTVLIAKHPHCYQQSCHHIEHRGDQSAPFARFFRVVRIAGEIGLYLFLFRIITHNCQLSISLMVPSAHRCSRS